MNLCFDLDGPIIDVTDRYYRAYLESLKGSDTNQILPKEVFWRLKQNRVSDFEIGLLSGLTINEAKETAEIRKELSFKTEYFTLDKLFDDVLSTFNFLDSEGISFFVVTLRRRRQLQYAIKQFKLEKHIDSERLFSLPDDHKFTNDIQEKHIELVSAVNKLDFDAPNTWIIGDSETDIHAGRLAGYGKIIGITRGIRSQRQLEILNPDYIIDNFSEIAKIIK